MKLKEIVLTEAINLSRYYDLFTDTILNVFRKISTESVDSQEIITKLERVIQREARKIATAITGENYAIKIRFQDIDDWGLCAGLGISLSTKLIDPTILTFRRTKNVDKINVSMLIEYLLHELVHAIQNIQQYKRGIDSSSTEYRSYLTKDTKNFEARLRSPDFSLDDYKLYYASPQEMTAFAHNLAVKLINKKLKNSSYFEVADISKVVREFLKMVFSDADKEDRKIAKVINKYYTLVYKEVMDYIEQRKSRS